MTKLSKSAFASKWNARFSDNITRDISEGDLREFVEDVNDSFINDTDFEAPSASFASITGEPTDNGKLNNWGTSLLNAIRGGVAANFNTLKKVYDALVNGDFAVSGNNLYIKRFSGVGLEVAGTNNYSGNADPAITSYSRHLRYFIHFANTNSGPSTLSLNGLAADSILNKDGQALTGGELKGIVLIGRSWFNNSWQIIGGSGIDAVPTNGSIKAVSSNGVYDALALKADLQDGKVPASQLPSFVDDIIEVADFASLPATGETGKIYVTLDNDKQYRWSGTQYNEIVASPGTSDEVTEGLNNLYFTQGRVRNTPLAGLDTGTGGEITEADLLLEALGKLQYQIKNRGINGGTA